MTFGDIIVLGILAAIVGSILISQFRNKKKGNSCGCSSCKGCTMAGKCQQEVR